MFHFFESTPHAREKNSLPLCFNPGTVHFFLIILWQLKKAVTFSVCFTHDCFREASRAVRQALVTCIIRESQL